ncbi:hypothetical protein [Alicyclobacillus pomorum]|uniref:hypothetical protein n=1 Tax=Alicyclobacillus pomorum TaxID=204470 RepID=UPI00047C9DDE
MVHHGHINRCMGQWVICHTRQGNIPGRLLGCDRTHLFLHARGYRTVVGDANETSQVVHSFGNDSGDTAPVSYYGYGYGAGGYGRTAVALASVVGLTAIGLSALWW